MLIWIIQISLFSIIFIIVVHNLFIFFINTLTVPKIKDLVNLPNQQYQEIYKTLGSNLNTISSTDINLLPLHSHNSQQSQHNSQQLQQQPQPQPQPILDINYNNFNMKDELKMFLKSQLN